MTTALVLAGTRKGGDPLAEFAGVTHKALIPIGGVPMLERVVDALKASGRIDRIVVSIDRPRLIRIPGVEVIRSAKSLSRSVIMAVESIGAPLLVTTGDNALLEPEWVRYFLDERPDKDVVAALARSEAVMAAAPDTKRTFLKFADGAFSGCNMFYLSHHGVVNGIGLWQEFEQLRKRPFKMLQKLGPSAVLAYALGRLTLARVIKEVERMGGLTGGVVEMPFGRAAIDVDKEADLVLVRRLVEQDQAA